MTKQAERPATKDDWCTPLWLLDSVELYKLIDLDPCSNPWAEELSVAVQAVDEGGMEALEEALGRPGLIFINPPYSSWRRWVNKVLPWYQNPERGQEQDTEVVLVLPRRSTTLYVDPPPPAKIELGRVMFDPPPGMKISSPREEHELWYYGTSPLRWCRRMLEVLREHAPPPNRHCRGWVNEQKVKEALR
jgi:hypothetical protein